jgi:hypothetical protein
MEQVGRVGCHRNKQKKFRFEPKQTEQDLFRLVFCMFRFNRNFETLFFGMEAKQLKQTVSKQTNKPKQTETNRNNPKLSEKIPKYALCQTVLVDFLFVLVQSKHQHSLHRYRSETTETNVLFRMVPKLVSVVSNRN